MIISQEPVCCYLY